MSRFFDWLYSDLSPEERTLVAGYWVGAFVGAALMLCGISLFLMAT